MKCGDESAHYEAGSPSYMGSDRSAETQALCALGGEPQGHRMLW